MRSIAAALLLAAAAGAAALDPVPSEAPPPAAPAADAPFDDAAALAELRRAIAGREKEPAETVFKNIRVHQGKPAGAILSIMDIGYRKSLGVHCTHCHTPSDWASDDKSPKRVARDMTRMVRRINDELLAGIEGLESEKPVVNCTTCHRGEVKPALDLKTP